MAPPHSSILALDEIVQVPASLVFKRGGTFPHPTLWLYGNHDPFYRLDHSRANFAAFQAAGGKGSFFDFEVPGGNGHRVTYSPRLWTGHVDRYLQAVGAEAKQ